ncbi:hypothetical protein [Tardiphaga sp.]|uniref:hypothetical protein n=1 Tax=Tardiphaga sp. TaxID=1926292 RepID=UPI0037DA436C
MSTPDTTASIREDILKCIQRVEWELGPAENHTWAQTFLQNAINLLDGWDLKESVLPQDEPCAS